MTDPEPAYVTLGGIAFDNVNLAVPNPAYVIGFEKVDKSQEFAPEWVNNPEAVETYIWNTNYLRLEYTFRATDDDKWALDCLIRGTNTSQVPTKVELDDYVHNLHGLTWVDRVEAEWDSVNYLRPWKIKVLVWAMSDELGPLTASVVFDSRNHANHLGLFLIDGEDTFPSVTPQTIDQGIHDILFYLPQGGTFVEWDTTGDVEFVDDSTIFVWGNCTVTAVYFIPSKGYGIDANLYLANAIVTLRDFANFGGGAIHDIGVINIDGTDYPLNPSIHPHPSLASGDHTILYKPTLDPSTSKEYIINGGFESNFDGWTVDCPDVCAHPPAWMGIGPQCPHIDSGTVHSGLKSVGFSCSATCSLSQTFAIPVSIKGITACGCWYYAPRSNGHNSLFSIFIHCVSGNVYLVSDFSADMVSWQYMDGMSAITSIASLHPNEIVDEMIIEVYTGSMDSMYGNDWTVFVDDVTFVAETPYILDHWATTSGVISNITDNPATLTVLSSGGELDAYFNHNILRRAKIDAYLQPSTSSSFSCSIDTVLSTGIIHSCEDLSTYTFTAGFNRTSKCQVEETLGCLGPNYYGYKDYGVDYFTGSYLHALDWSELWSISSGASMIIWMVANGVGDYLAMKAAGTPALAVEIYADDSLNYFIRIHEVTGVGTENVSSLIPVTFSGATAYFTFDVSPTTLTFKWWNDVGRTSLRYTISLSRNGSQSFRYVYIGTSGIFAGDGHAAGNFTVYVDHFDLNYIMGRECTCPT